MATIHCKSRNDLPFQMTKNVYKRIFFEVSVTDLDKNIYIYIFFKNAIVRIFRTTFPAVHFVPVSSSAREWFCLRGSEYVINFSNEITSVGDL